MSQLSKVLEKRIQELTASIDAQKQELAAYERVLHMEVTKGGESASTESGTSEEPAESSVPRKKRAYRKGLNKRKGSAVSAPESSEPEASGSAPSIPESAFAGNKTNMVAEIVKGHGSAGATPKEVDAFFTSRNIDRSKNLIYNTLSYLVAQKKLQRREGKYFALSAGVAPGRKKRANAVPPETTAPRTKRRLSPEGLKRIKDALKKRWAAKRAADASGGKATKKK